MRASWSLALKSAAVSEAKTVGSKAGGSPTVATSCPVRSTMSAVRAFDSRRNPASTVSMFRESSSRNDQLDAPPLTARHPRSACRSQFRLEPPDNGPCAAPQHRMPFPGQVVPQEADPVHPALPGEEAERAQPPDRRLAEQVPRVALESTLRQQPADHQAGQRSATCRSAAGS